MFLLVLAACGFGTFTTTEGTEPVRGALYFAPDNALSLDQRGARVIYVVVTNSTFPCWPEDTEDDPRTERYDEELAAETYWEAQIATAFYREGAFAVALQLAVGPDEDWLGHYALHSDAWTPDDMARYVEVDGRVGAGAWYEVIEASVDDASGVLYATDIVADEAEYDLQVGAPAWVEVDRKDTDLTGELAFEADDIGATFRADRCDNTDLLTSIYQILAQLALTSGAIDPDTLLESDTD